MSLNDGYVYRHRVPSDDAGATVLAYHAARFPHHSHETWRASIEEGRVLVNREVASAEQVLRAHDAIEFHRPPWAEPDVPLAFTVMHEDEELLAVEKPAGLQVLPAGPFTVRTLLHLVRTSAPDRADSSPVHRLGRGTSGLILFGKTPFARASLSAQFRDCTPLKTYLALARGTDLPNSTIARHPIGAVEHGPLRIYCAAPGGKPSVTRLRVLARDFAADRSLVAAQPITGRADQIRIHLAACGAPLVGDPLFGIGGVPFSNAPPGQGGYSLHAAGLRVLHPATGRCVKLRSCAPWLDSVAPRSVT